MNKMQMKSTEQRTIRFFADHATRETEPKSYKAGKSYKMTVDSCEHFVRRDLAEYVDEPSAVKTEVKTEKKA